MQFKDGTNVYSFDGKQVGRVERVVLNPKTKEVTDIVVRKGFLFTEDKTVPIRLIASATEDRISLGQGAELAKLPKFEETRYISLSDDEVRDADYPPSLALALYWNPPLDDWMDYDEGLGYPYPPQYRIETDQNIPQGTVALKEGAQVFNSNNDHVGNVKRIFTEPSGNRVSHFLMSEGLIFKQKKLVPVTWIRDIQEDEIYLGVGTAMLNQLPEYQETPQPQLGK